MMFAGTASLSAALFIYSLLCFEEKPPTPPSQAQAKLHLASCKEGEEKFQSVFKSLWNDSKSLFKSCAFVVVLLVFGASYPIQRTNTVVWSSLLHQALTTETQLNKYAGVALAMSWMGYTIGAFVAGLVISKTKSYKSVVVASMASLVISCAMSTVGILYANMRVVNAATVLQGLTLGFTITSTYELLVEVTYPHSEMFVSLLGMGAVGVFRLLYPIADRVLLNTAGPTASTLFSLAVSFFLTLVLVLTKMEYKREQANEENSHLL